MKRIAKSFVISVALLVFLWQQVGMEALAQNKRIVNPKQVYTYEMMTKDIERLAQQYPDLIEVKSIGQTPYGREIWAVKLGNGTPNVFFNGSHHAREWLTTNLLMDMLDQYAQAYKNKQEISGYNVQSILDHGSIWFVPMVNPDGVTLQQSGLKAFPKEDHKKLIAMNNGGSNFARWKANAQGVDLNRQYPAGWDTIRNNVDKPHYMNHKGSSALSTRSKSLGRFHI
ncbi:M14 family zinc carboxypeptidase [Caldalkalibacillus mannanilyticus]|uniref:M14 family zinc carboxypeptidase n=1 Tax=Caldalkalibacillus mannanilyticus TaxID=1418 RepID=UPI00068852AA|nr:M14 family zinc carboxypeptidase [Caldalkalibacillus mannanilyticus]